jgi:nucleoside-diphosphate-sugar epimerase
MRPGTYVVTGAGGFVGRALSLALLSAGVKVIGIARGSYPELVAAGVVMHSCDLSTGGSGLAKILQGAEGVFHVAAKVDMWGAYDDFYKTNVLGTEAVILACMEAGVPRLVFTSSPSVVADGKDLVGVDESYPYPSSHMAFYPATKAIAERKVCAANREGVLHTVALRPHLIFGPGDNHFVPTILERARKGRLVQVGAGQNLTDLTFIEDCVRAHLLAMEALDLSPTCRGKAYFISQGEPVSLWGWIAEVLNRSGLPPVKRQVPAGVAMVLAKILEWGARKLPWSPEPLLSTFLVSQMATSHYFNISGAGRDLSFYPRFSMREAMDLTFPEVRK